MAPRQEDDAKSFLSRWSQRKRAAEEEVASPEVREEPRTPDSDARGEETIDPKADGNWRFEPAPGHAAIFDTGPRSQDHLDDVSQLDLSPVGDTPDGYRRYRLTL